MLLCRTKARGQIRFRARLLSAEPRLGAVARHAAPELPNLRLEIEGRRLELVPFGQRVNERRVACDQGREHGENQHEVRDVGHVQFCECAHVAGHNAADSNPQRCHEQRYKGCFGRFFVALGHVAEDVDVIPGLAQDQEGLP